MDIDLRWGGDPSIILAVEAALVASIPIQVGALNILPPLTVAISISQYSGTEKEYLPLCFFLQLKDLKVFTVVRAIFQLTDEIPCISAVVVALLAEVYKAHIKLSRVIINV